MAGAVITSTRLRSKAWPCSRAFSEAGVAIAVDVEIMRAFVLCQLVLHRIAQQRGQVLLQQGDWRSLLTSILPAHVAKRRVDAAAAMPE